MAELYLKQGHPERAVEIYQRLVRQKPQDPQLAGRLAEIQAMVTAQPAAADNRGGGMSFRENLQRIVDSVPGAISAMIMGFDGIAIESYENPQAASPVDLQTLLVEYSSATQQLRRAAGETPALGGLVELSILRQGNACLLRPLTEEYFMAVVVTPNGLLGKARYMLRVVAPQMMKEF